MILVEKNGKVRISIQCIYLKIRKVHWSTRISMCNTHIFLFFIEINYFETKIEKCRFIGNMQGKTDTLSAYFRCMKMHIFLHSDLCFRKIQKQSSKICCKHVWQPAAPHFGKSRYTVHVLGPNKAWKRLFSRKVSFFTVSDFFSKSSTKPTKAIFKNIFRDFNENHIRQN